MATKTHTFKIKVDTTELDSALKKLKEINGLVEIYEDSKKSLLERQTEATEKIADVNAVSGLKGMVTFNEARQMLSRATGLELPPIEGGDEIYE